MRSIVGLALGFIVAASLVRAAFLSKSATLEWSIQSPFETCVSDGNDFIACASPQYPNTMMLSINPLNGSTLWQVANQVQTGYGMTMQFCPQHPELAFLDSAGSGGWSGALSAVSKSTGTVLWSFDTLSTFTNQIATQCSDDGALVYVITPNNFFAVDVRTGGLKWLQYVNTSSQYQLVEVPDRTKAATTKSSSLFFADSQGLHRVDSATGKPLPFVPSNASIVVQNLPFGVVGTVALFATTQNTVAAMTSDGTLLWSTSLPIDQVVGDVLISYPSLSSTSQIQSLNASTGETLWMVHLSSSSNPQLAASNNKFIVYSYASTNGNYTTIGRLEARELSTGNVSWSLENLATEFGNTWASKDYLGFVAPNGGITGISIASGTNRTLPLLSPLNGLIEAKKLLIVQNDTNAFAFRKW